MNQVRIGIAGSGWIAGRHIGNLQSFADVKIVAVADPIFDRACAQAERCNAHAYVSLQEMLERDKVDAVYVCVPPFAHGEIESALLDHKLPFFVEKPLATDLATAEEIAARVAEQELVTAVGYHWRYLDTTQRAQELLAANPARLALGYWLDFTPPPAWWARRDQSGGQMVEQTTHIFDLARLLVGEVVEVFGAGSSTPRPQFPGADIFDVSLATLRFANGAAGNMASTCLLDWPHRIGLHLFGETLAIELSEKEMSVRTGGDAASAYTAEVDPFLLEDRAFIDAVQGKPNRIRASYAEALKTHRITMAAEESARSGRIVRLEEEPAHV
jgi:predicted dehydrogenase